MSKIHRIIAHCPVPPPKCQYQQNTIEKQKLNPSCSAPPHTKTRATDPGPHPPTPHRQQLIQNHQSVAPYTPEDLCWGIKNSEYVIY